MINSRKIINEVVANFVNGNKSKNLTLYHGSDNRKIYNSFFDNQFFTVNDYIASNYAYNNGGYMYKVLVSLNPLNLIENRDRMENSKGEVGKGGPYTSGTDYFIVELMGTLYGDDAVDYMKKYGFNNHLPNIVDGDYEPLIKYAKSNGFDSLLFIDESFDAMIKDSTYIIFDGKKPKIVNVYDVDDAVDSNFSVDFKIIK